MNLKYATWLFILLAVFATRPVLSLGEGDVDIDISGADEQWTADTEVPAPLGTSDLNLSTDEPVICHADEVWQGANASPEAMFLDVAFGGDFDLPTDKPVICHADEISNFDSIQPNLTSQPEPPVEDPIEEPTKNPVLFVPGLLGTEMFEGETKLWADILRMVNPSNTDNFMDPLQFNDDLTALDKDIFYGSVISNPNNLYNYTQELKKEFEMNGYIEGKNFFTFPYDWRYGVSGKYSDQRNNSDLLAEKINLIIKQTGSDHVDIIAHSLGGLIVKKYIMEHDNPKIGKLIYVGVPNLGSPKAAKALLIGDDFNVSGLNSAEMKKISQNMPAAYDLLPSQGYFGKQGGYLINMPYSFTDVIEQEQFYDETMLHLAGWGANPIGVAHGKNLHSTEFDSFDARTRSIDVYNIVGCKSSMFRGVRDRQSWDLTWGHYGIDSNFVTSDDTVPFESADNIPANENNRFYFAEVDHGKMPSANGIRQKIVSIITGVEYPTYSNMVTHAQLVANPDYCQLSGDSIAIYSPLDIYLTDTNNNIVLGMDSNGNIHHDVSGASFDIIEGHKYLYLPQGATQQYNINLKGSGSGSFTLVRETIENGVETSAQVFNDQPVTPEFSAILSLDGNTTKITTINGTNIYPTSEIAQNALQDIIPPQTELLINGSLPQNSYVGTASINLSAQDFAQEGVEPSGVFSLNYSLDGDATTTINNASTTISIAQEGNHEVAFFAGDRLGNKGQLQTINFTIDNSPTIIISEPANDTYILNQPVAASYECQDSGSGIEACVGSVENGSRIDTSAIGEHTFTVTAIDKNRNQTIKTLTYKVVYRFDGFLQPINDTAHQICSTCKTSIFKGGSTIPVKFQLKDYYGNDVQVANAPVWLTPANIGLLDGQIDESLYADPATSGNLFRWDSGSQQYIFNWGTKGYATGYFWRIGVKLSDGSKNTVNIGLK